MKILFVSSEAHPLIKTGGLADVSGALPAALRALGHDVRIVMPAYRAVLDRIDDAAPAGKLKLPGAAQPLGLLRTALPGSGVPVYLVDAPHFFDRPGNPYLASDRDDWPDNAPRFFLLCQVAAEIACNRAGLRWRPEVVHCNDWQSGLVPVLLADQARRPATVFTIHNLAYQGLFPRATLEALGLKPELWAVDGLEFHGQLSFIKGGIAFADAVTTVSPTYAREICAPQFGHGLDGLLRHRAADLHGILNGADYALWDPARDTHIEANYDAKRLTGKARCKSALQVELGLEAGQLPLLVHVGRLVAQKGADLIAEAVAAFGARPPFQLAVLGSGEALLEAALLTLAQAHPGRIAVTIGYDEGLAHRLEAGGDVFLMPSRFEPCGLNQIYSLRYGTVPVVHRTGGLADTVIDAMEHTVRGGIATGFVLDQPYAFDLQTAISRALGMFARPREWRALMRTDMAQDFSWQASARQYARLYRETARGPQSQKGDAGAEE